MKRPKPIWVCISPRSARNYSTLLPLPPRLEAVCPPNPKILRFLLELLHPDEWGKHRKIDVPHKGGVLVVGYIAKKPEYSTAASVKARKWKSCSRRIREATIR